MADDSKARIETLERIVLGDKQSGVKSMNERFDNVDSRFDKADVKMDLLGDELGGKIDNVIAEIGTEKAYKRGVNYGIAIATGSSVVALIKAFLG